MFALRSENLYKIIQYRTIDYNIKKYKRKPYFSINADGDAASDPWGGRVLAEIVKCSCHDNRLRVSGAVIVRTEEDQRRRGQITGHLLPEA